MNFDKSKLEHKFLYWVNQHNYYYKSSNGVFIDLYIVNNTIEIDNVGYLPIQKDKHKKIKCSVRYKLKTKEKIQIDVAKGFLYKCIKKFISQYKIKQLNKDFYNDIIK